MASLIAVALFIARLNETTRIAAEPGRAASPSIAPHRGLPFWDSPRPGGDVILAVDGAAVTNNRALARKVSLMAPKSTVRLEVLRDGERKTLSVTLTALPEGDA